MRNIEINLHRFLTAIPLACTLFGLHLTTASAQAKPSVVNGAIEMAEPTTAALLDGDPDTGRIVCSATLIGCDSAITTAHCFNLNGATKNFLFFQHAGFVAIESATRHPAYVAAFPPNNPNFDVLRVEDIAFIKLAKPVSGITPSTVIKLAALPLGTPGRIVGFGRDPITAVSPAGVDDNAGIKRSGTMTIAACEGTLVGADVICWQPPSPPVPLGPVGQDVSTCEGDSGGPLFAYENGIRVVAGITKGAVFISGGQSDLCEPPVDPYDTNIDRHRIWIQGSDGRGGMIAVTGAVPTDQKDCGKLEQLPELVQSGDLLGNCDGTPWVNSPAPRTCGFGGFLDAATTNMATHRFPIPAGTSLLRVAFNGVSSSSGAVDTDYYLRASLAATTTQFDCAATGPGNLGYCEIVNPAADTWHVLVDQTLYQGEYQVAVTIFGPPAPARVSSLAPKTRVLLAATMSCLVLAVLARRSRSGLQLRGRTDSP